MKMWKEWKEEFLEGDLRLPKYVLWLIALTCMCMGMVYGLMMSPCVKGFTVGSYNGSCNGGDFGKACEQKKKCKDKRLEEKK